MIIIILLNIINNINHKQNSNNKSMSIKCNNNKIKRTLIN